MEQKKSSRLASDYVHAELVDLEHAGDSWFTEQELFGRCCRTRRKPSFEQFRRDLQEQIRGDKIVVENDRIYTAKTLRYENSAAGDLARILQQPAISPVQVPEKLTVNGVELCQEQRAAVAMALSNRLSLILGGAGSGKSTLIRAIVDLGGRPFRTVLCAPTGKAARNLKDRIGLEARTVHGALGMQPDEDFLSTICWGIVNLVIVDEASMLTLEMLSGILHKAPRNCRIVLLGDPNQLLSVGAGNVLQDLLELGFPCAMLQANHRQSEKDSALLNNVVRFSQLHREQDLRMDDSFSMRIMEESGIAKAVAEESIRRYLNGESVQVLSPFNRAHDFSAEALNRVVRERVNPRIPGKLEVYFDRKHFRDGDRVMILKNNWKLMCFNGDVGTLHILSNDPENVQFYVMLPDGRCPCWFAAEDLKDLALAYVLTIHKSQGSEYDTILLPLSMKMEGMLSRNLFYTAISRARKRVILFGNPQALDITMRKQLPPRSSMLAPKVLRLMEKSA